VKEARNQAQIFKRKPISRNTTHRHSYHLQAMQTGVKSIKANTRSEKINNPKTAMKTTHRLNRDKQNKTKTSCSTTRKRWSLQTYCIN